MSTIIHSYWSYVHQLSYRLGAPHCSRSSEANCFLACHVTINHDLQPSAVTRIMGLSMSSGCDLPGTPVGWWLVRGLYYCMFMENHASILDYRRKFRSETSDNMDSWKAEVRRVRREKIRRKKMQMREKVGKSRFTVFFQWFVAPEGRKVGSLKRRVRTQLARWEMKKCTPLWREAHFQVKMCKTHQLRTTFGSWDVEKVHAVVARSTFPSQKC